MSTQDNSYSRRDFLKATGAGAVVVGAGLVGAGEARAEERRDAHGDPVNVPSAGPAANPGAYNILFILVDQERFYRPNELPVGFPLPAHERLAKTGTTFVNHRINSAVCTSSRSVIYTGRHIQQTKMFDNTNFPWIQSLSTEMPTVGKMLREAGYYTAYPEQNNVPMYIKHPAHPGGRQCLALTSHLDLAPTFVAFANPTAAQRKTITADLPGKDISGLLAAPQNAQVNALHEAVLFNYNMFAYLDGEFMRKGVEFLHKGGNPKELLASGVKPDMRKRGAIRSIWDGRYVYARYFSPKQHNRPTTLEQIYKFNDVEVFDTSSDPLEMNNLAMDRKKHGDLVLALNAKMNRVLDAEVGEDRGQSLPGGIEAGWEVTPETMAGF